MTWAYVVVSRRVVLCVVSCVVVSYVRPLKLCSQILVYFSHIKTSFRDLVVLDPQFLADVMSGVVTFAHSLVKNGVLMHKDLAQVWSKFPVELHQSLLELLENFEIAHRLQKASPPASLIPCLLSEERPNVTAAGWAPVLPFGCTQYGRTYEFAFLPLGFVGRLLTRLLHVPMLEARLMWKHGMLISYGRYLGLLTYSPDDLVLKCAFNTL